MCHRRRLLLVRREPIGPLTLLCRPSNPKSDTDLDDDSRPSSVPTYQHSTRQSGRVFLNWEDLGETSLWLPIRCEGQYNVRTCICVSVCVFVWERSKKEIWYQK